MTYLIDTCVLSALIQFNMIQHYKIYRNHKNMDILEFKGEYRWLSNFWPVQILFDDVSYPSVEHAYQAAKTDPSQREPFKTGKARKAKRRGNSIILRPDWELIKVSIMQTLIAKKFSINSPLAKLLINTSPGKLIEGNNWDDRFWGICNGSGRNMLGELLMQQRDYLIIQINCKPALQPHTDYKH